MPDVSIITTCKGRLHHLRRSLPFLLDQQTRHSYDVIVVDYGCPDGAFDWCRQQSDPRLKCVGVNANVAEFNLNRAMNIGAKFAKSRHLLFADCDLLLPSDHLEDGMAHMQPGVHAVHYCVEPSATGNGPFYLHPPSSRKHGSSCVSRIYRRSTLIKLRGYDESFRGWGWNDVDLSRRLDAADFFAKHIEGRVAFLNHTDAESVRFYAEKDKAKSSVVNQSLMETPHAVNPHGWGIAGDDVRFHSQDAEWTNPNFIDCASVVAPESRGDRQAGWQEMVGWMHHDAHILDVGSGLGHSRSRLAVNSNSVTLHEPAVGYPSDVPTLAEIPSGSFDVVTAFDVVEHVEDDAAFVAELKRISRGSVFLSTPNFNASHCANWFHAREYRPSQFVRLLGAHRFWMSDARDGSTAREMPPETGDSRWSPVMAAEWRR